MQIRMLHDFTYPLDAAGSVTRTLPRGGVFDEAEAITAEAVAGGYAEPFDEQAQASVDEGPGRAEASDAAEDDAASPEAAAEPAALPEEPTADPAASAGKCAARAQA